ncbi:MAG: hypothetical protein GXP53_06685 [Deltaproteobacteria bacterium]|nr:hypothetical protein [Deltaproteobacteria bacterium]
MNKAIITAIIVICFAVFAGSALAGGGVDAISSSDFFYGVTIDNGQALHVDRTGNSGASIIAADLSNADFFYGVTTDKTSVLKTNVKGKIDAKDCAALSHATLSPEIFYGYLDATAENCLIDKL